MTARAWYLTTDRSASHYVDADGRSRCGAHYDAEHRHHPASRHWGVTPQCAECQQSVRDEIENTNAASDS